MIVYSTNVGWDSFIKSFRGIIFRWKGSIVPYIVPQLLIFVGLSFFVTLYLKPEPIDPKGHLILGVPLSFLLVFKSQLSYNQYWEGRGHVGEMVRACRSLVLQSLSYIRPGAAGDRVYDRHNIGRTNPELIQSHHDKLVICTLVKLFFVLVIEFCRSAGPGKMDLSAHHDDEDIDDLLNTLCCGLIHHLEGDDDLIHHRMTLRLDRVLSSPVLHSNNGFHVLDSRTGEKTTVAGLLHSVQLFKPDWHLDLKHSLDKKVKSGNGVDSLPSEEYRIKMSEMASGGQSYHRGKPLVCLQWIMETVSNACDEGRLGPMRLQTMDTNINCMMKAFNGMAKIDEMLFPFPYAQLVKVFEFIFCITLPFALYGSMGNYTPAIMALTVIGFYGIDAVGEILEDPFGCNPNDLNLDTMGDGLWHDIDMFFQEFEERMASVGLDTALEENAEMDNLSGRSESAPSTGGTVVECG